MTVENTNPIQHFTANGVSKVFAFDFAVEDKSNIAVLANGVTVEPSEYNYNEATRSIEFNTAPILGTEITVERRTALVRTINYQTHNNSFRPDIVNFDFDRIWRVLQEKGIESAKTLAGLIKILEQLSEADRQIVEALIEQTRTNIAEDVDNVELIIEEAKQRKEQDKLYNVLQQIQNGSLGNELKNYFNTVVASQTPNVFDALDTTIVFDTTENKTQAQINNDYRDWKIQKLEEDSEQVKATSVSIQQTNLDEFLNGVTVAPELAGKKLRVIAGSVRNTGDGWKWISDSAHTPVGVTPTITTSGVNLVINYGFTAKRVITLLATPDETLAGLGIIVGGSVGTTLTNLQLKAPLAFTVNTETAELTIPSYHLNTISATLVSGSCSITHPSVGMTGDAPVVTKLGSTGGHTEVLASYGTTQSILYGSGDLDGQIIYNGTAWVYSGELKTIPTMEWVTGGTDAYLRVVHSQTDVFNINIHSKTLYDIRPISVNGTEFRIRFYDAAGTLQLNPNTEMQFLFSRKACLPKNTIRGLYAVRRGYAGILPSDLISASGNIWIYGVMEV